MATTLTAVLMALPTVSGCLSRGTQKRPHYKRILPLVVEGPGKSGYRRPATFYGYQATTWRLPEEFCAACVSRPTEVFDQGMIVEDEASKHTDATEYSGPDYSSSDQTEFIRYLSRMTSTSLESDAD